MAVMPVSGCSVYVDPSHLRCAHCDQPVRRSEAVNRERLSRVAQSPQIWCENPDCPAKGVVADVEIVTLGASQHRKKVG